MSEKAMKVGFGQTIVVGYSEPVHSSQFPSFDDFAIKVQKEWDHQWQRVYSSQPEGKIILIQRDRRIHMVMCISTSIIAPAASIAAAL